MTLAGLCGLYFTYSYECTRNNVRCQIKQKENSSVLLQNIDNILIWCYIYGEKYKQNKTTLRLILWIVEINSQELDGKSAAGWGTAVRLTAQGRYGWWFTYSYECISPNVRCG